MGAVTFSIDPKLVEALSRCLSLDVFVETGTFCGETIHIVRGYFKHIYSVELSPHYFAKAQEKFSNCTDVTLINDDAARAIQALQSKLHERSVLYWLDAHWCVADGTAGETSQCPLLQELAVIEHFNAQSMIIIDDARLFLSTPQKPHEISNWPTLHEVIVALMQLSDRHCITVLNDCILFYPKAIHEPMTQFAHEHGIDWLDKLNQLKSSQEILARVSKENEMLHNLGVWRRVRGIFGYIWRTYGKKISSHCFTEAPVK